MTSMTILVIEDNPDDVELIQRALKRQQIANRIETVTDGALAIEYLFGPGRDRQPLPRAVLLDLKLPRVDGLQILKRIRAEERTRQLPVIILTSSDEHRDLVESYDLGANSYVVKPMQYEAFATAVEQLGAYWLLVNRVSEN